MDDARRTDEGFGTDTVRALPAADGGAAAREGDGWAFDDEVRGGRVPFEGATSGRLVFEGGAAEVELRGQKGLASLLETRFLAHARVRRSGEAVRVRLPRTGLFDWVFGSFREGPGELVLSADVPWDVEIVGGASHVTADLRLVQLRRLRVRGGVTHLALALGRPEGRVSLSVDGGVSHVEVLRPRGVPVRVRASGGFSHVELDGRERSGVADTFGVPSAGFENAEDSYELAIRGGASHVQVDEE